MKGRKPLLIPGPVLLQIKIEIVAADQIKYLFMISSKFQLSILCLSNNDLVELASAPYNYQNLPESNANFSVKQSTTCLVENCLPLQFIVN